MAPFSCKLCDATMPWTLTQLSIVILQGVFEGAWEIWDYTRGRGSLLCYLGN